LPSGGLGRTPREVRPRLAKARTRSRPPEMSLRQADRAGLMEPGSGPPLMMSWRRDPPAAATGPTGPRRTRGDRRSPLTSGVRSAAGPWAGELVATPTCGHTATGESRCSPKAAVGPPPPCERADDGDRLSPPEIPQNPAARSVADFLGTRVDGSELGRLRVLIGTKPEHSLTHAPASGVDAIARWAPARMGAFLAVLGPPADRGGAIAESALNT
jgi:hypothetical protein